MKYIFFPFVIINSIWVFMRDTRSLLQFLVQACADKLRDTAQTHSQTGKHTSSLLDAQNSRWENIFPGNLTCLEIQNFCKPKNASVVCSLCFPPHIFKEEG